MPTTWDIAAHPLKQRLKEVAAEKAKEEYTILPARVTSTSDYVKYQCLSIEVLISDIFDKKDDISVDTVKLEKVFVNLPRFGGWKFRYPVSQGDPVTVYWSKKDLSAFLDGTGEPVAQSISEVGGLEDCFIELQGGTRKNHNNPDLNNLEIEGPNTKMTITPSGNITTTTSGTYDITASHLTIHNDTTITKNLKVNGDTDIDGNLDVGKVTTSKGAVNAQAGVYATTYAGLSGGAMAVAVDMGINGTVTINGIEVNSHIHTDAEGRPTGAME